MGKILNVYKNDLDKSWFNSSNVVYAECDDKENELKTVRITFKNGATYEYTDVKVQDYLLFREDASNGKAFIKYIKKYDCKRLDDKNIDDLINEMNLLLEEANKVIENENNDEKYNNC